MWLPSTFHLFSRLLIRGINTAAYIICCCFLLARRGCAKQAALGELLMFCPFSYLFKKITMSMRLSIGPIFTKFTGLILGKSRLCFLQQIFALSVDHVWTFSWTNWLNFIWITWKSSPTNSTHYAKLYPQKWRSYRDHRVPDVSSPYV